MQGQCVNDNDSINIFIFLFSHCYQLINGWIIIIITKLLIIPNKYNQLVEQIQDSEQFAMKENRI